MARAQLSSRVNIASVRGSCSAVLPTMIADWSSLTVASFLWRIFRLRSWGHLGFRIDYDVVDATAGRA